MLVPILEEEAKGYLVEDLLTTMSAANRMNITRSCYINLFIVLSELARLHPNPAELKLKDFDPNRQGKLKSLGPLIRAIKANKGVIFEKMSPTEIAKSIQFLKNLS